ncbi:MAG: mannose-6-phosphate isomerase, class I [Cutibacterium granulosum]|uniref:mannose-6-phosphate isomerase, class I n=1 Tax=Cutibacterium granulosum TaxID=33011 RepID=UPI002B22746A|nr:mannose-6-phosphate isomerase, class I [Cutibacterium granulosum]MEA5649528.1 mannose-6-phosphate isomerase, class I [Cutibacterium granulosum]MEA5654837.1 mannose-6-phosphate isomerase, class I [Cutibacterium granulosum]MEA5663451.1 mannose-6-phosphate isomerase, class I [Cutibacterium granulosum]MEA5665149.1 mannose-6-phosphate isomerase, class I [Cutibacterium granulosum]
MHVVTGQVQHYDWGTTAEIPRLLGAESDGRPWAEYWLGAHPKAPSVLADDCDINGADRADGGQPLDRWLAEHPDQLGQASREVFGDRLSFLLKILSAEQPLSIQAHPSRTQAQLGFAQENAAGVPIDDPRRLYRDDWPKPEMIVALTEFHALYGFRDPHESRRMLTVFDAVDGFPGLVAPLDGQGSEGIAAVLTSCLQPDEQNRRVIAGMIAAAHDLVQGHDPASMQEDAPQLARTAVELDRAHPGDPSILAALLMNRVHLRPGESLFLGAGTMHAYLHGTGIEIMASSDNVLRGGLTSKHIDVPALLAHADLTATCVQPECPRQLPGGLQHYRTPFPEFTLWRLGERVETDLPATGLGRILLVLDGRMSLITSAGVTSTDTSAEVTQVRAGQAVWISAGQQVHVTGSAVGFLAAPGICQEFPDEL